MFQYGPINRHCRPYTVHGLAIIHRRTAPTARKEVSLGVYFSDSIVKTATIATHLGSNCEGNPTKSEIWLGRQDSNLRMPIPKTGALPLGHAPIRGGR